MSIGDRISVGGISADIQIDTSNLGPTLEKVRAALQKVDAEIERVQNEFRAGTREAQLLEAELDNLVATKQGLITAASQLSAAVNAESAAHGRAAAASKAAGDAANTLAIRMKAAGFAGISASRAFQDVAQSGPAAALNNLEFITTGVAQALGASAQQAMIAGAAVQGLATVAYLCYENWDKLQAVVGVGFAGAGFEGVKALDVQLKSINKEIDELRSKTRMTGTEFIQLANAERKAAALGGAAREEKAVNDLAGPAKEERERASAFSEAVKAQGKTNVEDELREHYENQAAQSGATLSRGDIADVLTKSGYAPHQIKSNDINAISRMFGVSMNAQDMQERAENGGPDIGKQVITALQKQRFLVDEQSDDLLTPGQMVPRRLEQGSKQGNRAAAEEVAGVLGPTSAFGQSYNQSSPEAQEGVKAADESDRALEEQISGMRKAREDRKRAAAKKKADEEKAQREQERAAREQERLHDQNVRESREAAPGINTIGEALASQVALGGLSPDQARGQIEAYLRANGRTAGQAQQAAGDIYADSEKDVKEGIVRRMFEPQEKEEAKKSEVFDAIEMASRIQASVGGDESKKQTGLLEDIKKALDEANRAGTINLRFAKK